MFAAIETQLIVLVGFVIVSAISAWMKKRKEAEAEKENAASVHRPRPAGAPPPVQQPAQQGNWEEELRKLLQGEAPEPQPAPPPIPYETRQPAPPPLPRSEPVTAPARRKVFEPVEESNPWDGDVAPRYQPRPELVESAYASSQASPLVQKTDYLRPGFDRPVAQISVTRKSASPEAAAAVAMLRQPLSARTAILASIIVGPPRALAD